MCLVHDYQALYRSFANTSQLVHNFKTLEPDKVKALLNETIHLSGDLWIKPGFLIAQYGSDALFEHTASIIKNEPVHSNGYTLLHTLTCKANLKMSRILYLLNNLMDVNVVDNQGRTCLFYVQNGRLFDILIQHGIDYNHTDKKGMVAGEFRHGLAFSHFCDQFYQYNALPLLKRALARKNANLANDTHEYVDKSQWSFDQHLQLAMLLDFKHLYSSSHHTYHLDNVLSPETLNDPKRLHTVIDEYCIKTYGRDSTQRIDFIVEGMKHLLLNRHDTKLFCFLKFHSEMLEEPINHWRYMCLYQVDLEELFHQSPNPIDYAQKFIDCGSTCIQTQSHWCLIISWLYAARNKSCKESYERLMKKVVNLRDTSGNTLLHILACRRILVECIFVDIEWIEQYVIEMGEAQVDALNRYNETPLFMALLLGDNKSFCRLMIKHNAHLDIKTKGKNMQRILTQIFGSEYKIPFPSLQCLAAKACNNNGLKRKEDMPLKMKHFIQMHKY